MQREAFGGGKPRAEDLTCQIGKGERPKPLPHLEVCTLGYPNPVYEQKIVLGISGRIPYRYWRIVKIGVPVVGSQSRRATRASQDHP